MISKALKGKNAFQRFNRKIYSFQIEEQKYLQQLSEIERKIT